MANASGVGRGPPPASLQAPRPTSAAPPYDGEDLSQRVHAPEPERLVFAAPFLPLAPSIPHAHHGSRSASLTEDAASLASLEGSLHGGSRGARSTVRLISYTAPAPKAPRSHVSSNPGSRHGGSTMEQVAARLHLTMSGGQSNAEATTAGRPGTSPSAPFLETVKSFATADEDGRSPRARGAQSSLSGHLRVSVSEHEGAWAWPTGSHHGQETHPVGPPTSLLSRLWRWYCPRARAAGAVRDLFDDWWMSRVRDAPYAAHQVTRRQLFNIALAAIYLAFALGFGIRSPATAVAPMALGLIMDFSYVILIAVLRIPRHTLAWLSPLVVVTALAATSMLDLPSPNYAHQPAPIVAALHAVTYPSTRGLSAATAPLMCLFPVMYLAVASRICAPGTFYRWHLLHFFLWECIVIVSAWSIREDELGGLHHVTLVDAMRAGEAQSDEILALMLPREVLTKLKGARSSDPLLLRRYADAFDAAAVLFVDILVPPGALPAAGLLDLLNTVFLTLDAFVEDAGVLKVETVGSQYVIASSVPTYQHDYIERLARLALRILAEAAEGLESTFGAPVEFRLGLNAGKLVGGIIGRSTPRFRLVGDVVNVASRMASTCPPGKTQLTEAAAAGLHRAGGLPPGLALAERGIVSVKGKGLLLTYFLQDASAPAPIPAPPNIWRLDDGGGGHAQSITGAATAPSSPRGSVGHEDGTHDGGATDVGASFRSSIASGIASVGGVSAAGHRGGSRRASGASRRPSGALAAAGLERLAAMATSLEDEPSGGVTGAASLAPRGEDCVGPAPRKRSNASRLASFAGSFTRGGGAAAIAPAPDHAGTPERRGSNVPLVITASPPPANVRRRASVGDPASAAASASFHFGVPSLPVSTAPDPEDPPPASNQPRRSHALLKAMSFAGDALGLPTAGSHPPTLAQMASGGEVRQAPAVVKSYWRDDSYPTSPRTTERIDALGTALGSGFADGDGGFRGDVDPLTLRFRNGFMEQAYMRRTLSALLSRAAPLIVSIVVSLIISGFWLEFSTGITRWMPVLLLRSPYYGVELLFTGVGLSLVALLARQAAVGTKASLAGVPFEPLRLAARRFSRYVFPRTLPLGIAVGVCLYLSYAYFLGAEFTVVIFSMMVLAKQALRAGSAWSWMLAPVAGTLVVTFSLGVTIADGVRGGLPAGAIGAGGGAIEMAFTYFAAFYVYALLLARETAGAEQRSRADFVAELAIKMTRETSRKLVRSLVPLPVIREIQAALLRTGGSESLAWEFPTVAIVQLDVVEFTRMSSQMSPDALCALLHELFTSHDEICAIHGALKIETVGDAWIGAAGAVAGDSSTPEANARRLARAALDMQECVSTFKGPNGRPLRQRCGLHAGPVTAGIVGSTCLRYHLFGEANDAVAILEQLSLPAHILCSHAFASLLAGPPVLKPPAAEVSGPALPAGHHGPPPDTGPPADHFESDEFVLEPASRLDLPGCGMCWTYWLSRKREPAAADGITAEMLRARRDKLQNREALRMLVDLTG